MNRRALELIASGIFAALFASLLYEGAAFPGRSAYMPIAASSIGLSMCCLWAIQSARLLALGQIEYYNINRRDILRFAMIIATGAAYVTGFVFFGFFTSTVIMLPSVSIALGYRNWKVIALTTLGFCLVLYAVFRLLLSIPLPQEYLLTLLDA